MKLFRIAQQILDTARVCSHKYSVQYGLRFFTLFMYCMAWFRVLHNLYMLCLKSCPCHCYTKYNACKVYIVNMSRQVDLTEATLVHLGAFCVVCPYALRPVVWAWPNGAGSGQGLRPTCVEFAGTYRRSR